MMPMPIEDVTVDHQRQHSGVVAVDPRATAQKCFAAAGWRLSAPQIAPSPSLHQRWRWLSPAWAMQL